MMKVGMSIVNKGVALKEIFTYIGCLSDNDVFIFSFSI